LVSNSPHTSRSLKTIVWMLQVSGKLMEHG
jgi:hypothetical protein